MAERRGSKEDRHERALECFKVAVEAESEQRDREIEDLRFSVGEQWPEGVLQGRKAQPATGTLPAVPARPAITINKLEQPIAQGINQMRNSHLAIKFSAKGNGATKEIAELYTDIARAVQTDSRANLAREWAFDRMYRCGRGAYRIVTEYANDGDFDLDIVYKRILNQASVYFDPFAQEPDWSDGEWAFVVTDMPLAQYRREFGDSELAKRAEGDDHEALHGIGDAQARWITFSETGKASAVRVAEYFYVEHETRTLVGMPDGDLFLDEVPDEHQAVIRAGVTSGALRSRDVDQRRVRWCKLNGVEILEEGEWDGRYIPIIPVIGREFNIDGERRWEGIVRPARGAQESYNYMRSAQVESIGLAPRAPFIVDPLAIEGYESHWGEANTRNFPYLPYRSTNAAGQQYLAPQRSVIEPAIQAITLAAHEADGDIKATTGFFDASLGNLNPSDRSGKAILALQKQQEQGGSGYLNSLTSVSMVLEGKILRDLIPRVYDRPGRIVAAIGEDDNRRSVMLGQKHTMQDGEPMPAEENDPTAKRFDLAAGQYTVAVSIGKSNTTKREEGAQMLGEVLAAMPQLIPVLGDLYFAGLDVPFAQQMADRMKKQLPPNLQEDENSPEAQLAALQQQAAQMQQAFDLMTKELDAKTKMIETDVVKAHQAVTLEQMKIESDEKIAFRKIEADLEKAAAASENAIGLEELKGTISVIEAELAAMRAQEQQAQEQAFAAASQGAQMAHEAGMQEGEQAGQMALQEQGAALEPAPEGR